MDTTTKITLDPKQLEELVAEALKSHPMLTHVQRAGIVRLYGGLPNWDIAAVTPELSSEQYLMVQEIVSGLRFAYSLRNEPEASA